MSHQPADAQAKLQQIALSLTNITFAIDTILDVEADKISPELRQGMNMIRDYTEATSEQIYGHGAPKPPMDGVMNFGQVATAIAGFKSMAA